MNVRHPLLQAAAIIAVAVVLGIVANGFAARDRRLVLPGYYPGALRVPPHEAAGSHPPPPTMTTQTTVAAVATPATATVPTAATPVAAVTSSTPPLTSTTTAATAPATARVAPHPTSSTPAPTGAAPAPSASAAKPKPSLERFQPHPDKAFVEISGDDVQQLHDAGALFLDARRSSVYADGHIPGARSFSVWESDIDDKVNALFNERGDPREQNLPIVIYCSGGACEDSHMLAEKLWGIQFNNVYVYRDGFPDWQQRGLPVHTGANP